MAAAKAEVTSPTTPTTATPAAAAPPTERSSIPRSKALISPTSVESADQSRKKPAEMNGRRRHFDALAYTLCVVYLKG